MVIGSASNSDGLATTASIADVLAVVPDEVTAPAPELIGGVSSPQPGLAPVVMLEPWAGVNVAWCVPLAGKLIQLPYEQAAKATKDDCWIVTDEQLGIINPALENAIKWVVWRFGAANAIGHPLVAFAAALGGLTAVKYGVYQFNQQKLRDGGPPPNQQSTRRTGAASPFTSPASIPTATPITNGKMAESGGESYSPGSPEAGKVGFSNKEFVIVDE